MKKNRLDSIKNEFLDIYAAIQDLSEFEILNNPEGIFQSHFERLQRLIAMDIDNLAADEMLCDQRFQSITKYIAHLKTINGLRMEIRQARAVIADPDPWSLLKRFQFYPNYLKLAQMEYKGGKLKPGDRVVFLGSGPLPLSLICLCTQNGVKGIGIEQKAEYALLSKKVIKALKLTDHIQIIQGNHFSLPLGEKCNLVMVGADAIPKDEIFDHLAKVFSKGTKFSYRIYEKGLRRLMDENPVTNILPVLKEYACIRPEPPVNNTCVFLVKITP
ncbi:MAG: nicotianamine synthase family protein [Pseudomonadota bacterium]